MPFRSVFSYSHSDFSLQRVIWLQGGKGLLVSANQQLLRIQPGSDEVVQQLQDYPQVTTLTALSLSPDQRYAAAGSLGGDTLAVWELASGRIIAQVLLPERIFGLSFSPDGQALLAAAQGQAPMPLSCWDWASGKQIQAFDPPDSGLNCYFRSVFSPDGHYVAATGSSLKGNRLLIWELASGNCVLNAPLKNEGRCLRWSDQGLQVAACGKNLTLSSWPLSPIGAKPVTQVFKGHARPVMCAALSPDGTRLASASASKDSAALRLWDPATGQEVAQLPGHGTTDLAFSPDGSELARLTGFRLEILSLHADAAGA